MIAYLSFKIAKYISNSKNWSPCMKSIDKWNTQNSCKKIRNVVRNALVRTYYMMHLILG